MRLTAFGVMLSMASAGLCQINDSESVQSLLAEVHQLRLEFEAAVAQGASNGPFAPTTNLERFTNPAGSVVTFGFEDLGGITGVAVGVRELRASKGGAARGLIVEVTENSSHAERSYVDADELADLVNGFDTLLSIGENPTPFSNFEVRYATRGNLQLSAASSPSGGILYTIRAGRITIASRVGLSAVDMQKLRGIFAAAREKLTSLPGR